MVRFRRLFAASILAIALATACGGGNDGPSTPPPPPAPQPTPPPENPCLAVSLEPEALSEESATIRARKLGGLNDDGGRYRVLDQIWKHRAAAARRPSAVAPLAATVRMWERSPSCATRAT